MCWRIGALGRDEKDQAERREDHHAAEDEETRSQEELFERCNRRHAALFRSVERHDRRAEYAQQAAELAEEGLRGEHDESLAH